MFKLNTFLFLALLFAFSFSFAQDVRNCGAMEHLEMLQQQNPEVTQQMNRIEQFTERYVANYQNDVSRAVVTIPVVVHVIYYRRSSVQNISDAQIQSQIDILTEDFRRTNTDASQTRAEFAGVAVDTEIEFCLATVDPNGNSTNGITRTSSRTRTWGLNDQMKFSSNGGHDAWPASDYLNIWVCDISSGYLGYAQFPGGPAATDGVVIDYAYFGNIGTATAPFHLGRTGTHEVGHWLNLRHIWGDGGCSVDDFVGDTPLSDAPNYGCALSHASCGSTDMVENYMDYSDDACMNVYTFGQKLRMQALFGTGGARASLLNSNGCGNPGTGPTCSDGIQNGDETGVDCGGSICPPCNTGSCDTPTGISVSVNGNRKKKVALSWSAVSAASSYDARLREVGSSSWTTQNTTGTSVNFNGLNGNTDYEYEVRSNCSSGSSAWSGTATVSTRQSAARVDQDWMAFPNPADDALSVQFLSLPSGEYTVSMMDIYGRSVSMVENVSPDNTPMLELSVSSLKPGFISSKSAMKKATVR
ncbi:MAG: M43 family zinc metalloprotease [Bacteroidia bacterium]